MASILLRLHIFVLFSGLVTAAHDLQSRQDKAGSSSGAAQGGGGGGGGEGGGGGGGDGAPNINDKLPYIIYLTLGGVALLAAIYHLVSTATAYLRKLASLNNATQRSFITAHPTLAILKEHLLYAPLLGKRQNNELKLSRSIGLGTVPGRLPTLLICGVVAMNVTLMVIDIPWSDPEKEVAGMLFARAGILTVINLVPMVIMAGRNNIFIKLTGTSFDTFNLFHRWLARIVVLEAITHALAFIIPYVQKGGFAAFQQALQESTQVMTGLVTAALFTALMLHSFAALRHAFYETFLHLHFAMVAVSMGFVWVHLKDYPQYVYIYAALGAWAGERVCRLVILTFRNLGSERTTALVEALPGDAIRVTLRMARSWKFLPGQNMYLYIPSVGLWTSHPFSVAWNDGGLETISEDKGLVMTRQDILALQSTRTISLVVRRKKGFTDKLYKRAANSSFGRVSLTAFAEGPYGGLHNLDSYGTVMLFAGGVGITHPMPYVRHLVAGFAEGTVAARRLTLVWTVQSLDHLEWVRPWMKTIVEMNRCEEILRVLIFITRPSSPGEVRNNSEDSIIHMSAGRPDVDTLVGAESGQQVGAMGVAVCGAGSLADEVRHVCRKRQAFTHIDYLEESFTW